MKILVTGFEPFGGENVNPSYEAVKLLKDEINGAQIIKRSLPVVFGKSVEKLIDVIEEEKPNAVLCLGQAGGTSALSVERVGINLMDSSQKDNDGRCYEEEVIFHDGERAYFSSLPIKAIVKRIRDNKLPAVISNTAGTYVCNNVLYGLLYSIDKHHPALKGGFIHVPFIPEQVLDKPGKASMSLDDIVRGITFAIEAISEERN